MSVRSVTLKLLSPMVFESLTKMPDGPTLRRSMLPVRVKLSVVVRSESRRVYLLHASMLPLICVRSLVSARLPMHLTTRQVTALWILKLRMATTPGRAR